MKKYRHLLLVLITLTSCLTQESRSWIIPVTIDVSDILYTPGQMEGYEKRRRIVLDSMGPGYLVLKSSDQASYNRHDFKPNNYFFYLSGYNEPGSYLILKSGSTQPFTLSIPSESTWSLIYQGEQQNADSVKRVFGADRILTSGEVRLLLDSILGSGLTVYTDLRNRPMMDELQRIAGEDPAKVCSSAAPILDEMRVFKDPLEIARLQKANNITSLALTRVMKKCKPGLHEFQMESVIEGTYLEYGSPMPGFPSIVGSGANSTILHYEANTSIMEDGELLLMDVGASYDSYTADISRTIPVNGKFSMEQRTIYQLVLDAQLAAINTMKPGHGFMDAHLAAQNLIVDGLHKLGLITDPECPWQVRFYILHPFSHYLGMDVHDVGDMGGNFRQFMEQSTRDSIPARLLQPGMVLTIEPGLYFRANGLENAFEIFKYEADSSEIASFIEEIRPVYEKYINIGVRIEDDILITREGNLNLSRYAPKEIEDIEQVMR